MPCSFSWSRSGAVANEFASAVVTWVAHFEAQYSRFIPDSLIGRINAAAGEHWVEVDAETDRLFSFCNELVFFTRGAFDPTSLPIIQLWNWKTKPASSCPTTQRSRPAQRLVGWRKVQRRPGGIFLPRAGMCLDLGGIGKEYAVDCVMNMAAERGIANVMVDFGRTCVCAVTRRTKDFWLIGLEDAREPGTRWAAVAVTDHAVATSGDYSAISISMVVATVTSSIRALAFPWTTVVGRFLSSPRPAPSPEFSARPLLFWDQKKD